MLGIHPRWAAFVDALSRSHAKEELIQQPEYNRPFRRNNFNGKISWSKRLTNRGSWCVFGLVFGLNFLFMPFKIRSRYFEYLLCVENKTELVSQDSSLPLTVL